MIFKLFIDSEIKCRRFGQLNNVCPFSFNEGSPLSIYMMIDGRTTLIPKKLEEVENGMEGRSKDSVN